MRVLHSKIAIETRVIRLAKKRTRLMWQVWPFSILLSQRTRKNRIPCCARFGFPHGKLHKIRETHKMETGEGQSVRSAVESLGLGREETFAREQPVKPMSTGM